IVNSTPRSRISKMSPASCHAETSKNLLTGTPCAIRSWECCAYCIDMHSRDLLKGGLAVEKLVLVPAWREAGSLFDSRERAALAWAETVTRVADTAIPDGEFESASAAFSEKELTDLTIAIGLMNAYNRLAIGFRNPPKAAT